MDQVRQHHDAFPAGKLDVPPEALVAIEDLYHRGKFLQAYERSQAIGPLQQWQGTDARILAGRLLAHVGASRLARAMHIRVFREHPEHLEARFYFLYWAFSRRGPWAALQWLERFGDPVDARPTQLADWFALRANVFAAFRDFETSDHWMRRAFEIEPERPWLWVEQASIFERQDRQPDALAAGRKALELRPWYRPAVQHVAYRLVQLNRDAEALELLREATTHLESGDVVAQLAALQTELQQYDEARRNFERVEQLQPLISLDKPGRNWLAARKADAAYYCGDLTAAATFAEQSDNKFFTRLAERLRTHLGGNNGQAKRVLLPVQFVEQHHMTCAPATLSAIAGYWSRPAEHLEIAESICYDGTPGHFERRWAEEHEFATREFRVTWDSAVALLDRGVPFTLTTVNPGSGHLQAVIGYDELRGTLVVRDPNERHSGEFACEQTLEYYASTGPRGMAMVPRERAELLDGIELPEAPLYDRQYEIDLALERHDRSAAVAALVQMRQLDPGHRLTLRATGTLSNYDADRHGFLESVEQLLKLFPKDVNLTLSRLNCLSDLGRRSEYLESLAAACASPDADSLFWDRYARELADDARQHPEAERLLRRALKYRPVDGQLYWSLGNLRWDQQRRDESLRLYRLAACLDDKQETPAKAYFQASRHHKQTEVALRFLEDRFRRFGSRSARPALTLCSACDLLDATQRAFERLEEALRLRPDDPTLLLYAADLHGRYGRHERTAELLAAAQPKTNRADWLRAAARLAGYRGDAAAALGFWRDVTEAEPQSCDAHECVAGWLADVEGEDAVVPYLRRQVERFPRNFALRSLLIEWLRSDPAEEEVALRELLAQYPNDAWAQRELASVQLSLNQPDAAAATIELARQLDPLHPYVGILQGRLEEARGRLEAAKEAFRGCLRLSVDFESAVYALLDACESKAEREAELKFIADELRRQVTFGSGLLAWHSRAKDTLPGETVLETLRAAWTVREDLWQTWTALTLQHLEMKQIAEARQFAEQAVERFPLLPRTRFDLALVCREAGDTQAEIDALEQTLAINPTWTTASRQLAETYELRGDLARARTILESAGAHEPREPRNHGCLADILWKLGEKEAAVARAEQSLRLDMTYDWAWHALRSWWRELDRPQRAVEFCRELTANRPRSAQAWLSLADVFDEPEQFDEALAALDRAIEISPRNVRAHQLKAWYLAQQKRFDEALAVVRSDVFPEPRPLDLRSREAMVLQQMGQTDDAIACLRAVTEADPDFRFAWQYLSEWLYERDDAPAYLEAARNYARLAPQTDMAWGYLGDAELRSGNKPAARAAFERAFAMSAEYRFAAASLFDMQLEADEFDAAAKTLDIATPHLQLDYAPLYRLQLAAKKALRGEAVQWFAELCAVPDAEDYPVRRAAEILIERGWHRDGRDVAQQRLQAAVDDPSLVVARPVVRAWAKLCFQSSVLYPGATELFLRQLRPTSLIGPAALAVAREIVDRNWNPDAVHRIVRRYRSQLRAENGLWHGVGSVLLDLCAYGRARKWLGDWRERGDATAHQLFIVVVAYWGRARPHEAMEVTRRALSRDPDTSTPNHQVWSGVYNLIYGDTTAGAADLTAVHEVNLWEYYHDLRRLAESVATSLTGRTAAERLADSPAATPADDYAASIRRLNAAWAATESGSRDDLLRRLYWMLRGRLAKHFGRRFSSAWCTLRATLSRVRLA